ncbi:MAG: PEP-CTERM sorting domain-containing protein [Desulforhopalus sp.]|nr:PEP-CTERM sorting domain-containing protein [Desulforhopalus sp.]
MKQKYLVGIACGMMLLGMAGMVNATLIFSDNFDGENNGNISPNYVSFDNWTVSDGNVDLVSAPLDAVLSINTLTDNGLFVDMDGSGLHFGNMDAGKMTHIFTLDPGDYILSYSLAGNQRRPLDIDQVNVSVGQGSLVNSSHALSWDSPFTSFTQEFSIASIELVQLSFEGIGGDDIGMLLDDIKLEKVDPVPESATILLMGIGLAGLVNARRKNKR